jgi:hypothetical protein
MITLPEGLYSEEYKERHSLCFTGENRNTYEPARYFAERVESDKKYILINLFHDTSSTARGRQIATDFDLLFRKRVSGNLRNDNKYRINNWKGYDELLILGDSCEDAKLNPEIARRINQINVNLGEKLELMHPSENICLVKYRILF